LTHTLPTDEPNGISVIIPLGSTSKVDKYSVKESVTRAIREQLVCFRKYFRVVNDLSIPESSRKDITDEVFKDIDPLYDDSTVTIFKTKGHSVNYKIEVGNVVYPMLHSVSTYNGLNTNNMGHGLLVAIKIPIGKLDIPMNRESINGSEENKRILETYYKASVLSLGAHYTTAVNSFTTVSKFLKDVAAIRTKYNFIPQIGNSTTIESLIASKTCIQKLMDSKYPVNRSSIGIPSSEYTSTQLIFQRYKDDKHQLIRRLYEHTSAIDSKQNLALIVVPLKVSKTRVYKDYLKTLTDKKLSIIIVKYNDEVDVKDVSTIGTSLKDIYTDYTTSMGSTFEFSDETTIAAWVIANPVVKAVSTTVRSTTWLVGRYDYHFNNVSYLNVYPECVNTSIGSPNSIAKLYDANDVEIPFGPAYYPNNKNIVIMSKNGSNDTLPFNWKKGLTIGNKTIKTNCKDFILVYVTPSFRQKVIDAFEADSTYNVYYGDNGNGKSNLKDIAHIPLDASVIGTTDFKNTIYNILYTILSSKLKIQRYDMASSIFLIQSIKDICKDPVFLSTITTPLDLAIVSEIFAIFNAPKVFDTYPSSSILEDSTNAISTIITNIVTEYVKVFSNSDFWRRNFNDFYNGKYCNNQTRDEILLANRIIIK
jgi:hypothetical protein